MSKVAALQPGGRDRMRSTVAEKVPHAVGKSSESMKELTDRVFGSFRGKDRSWIIRKPAGPGFGMRPSGEVMKKPIKASRSVGVKGGE